MHKGDMLVCDTNGGVGSVNVHNSLEILCIAYSPSRQSVTFTPSKTKIENRLRPAETSDCYVCMRST